LWAFWG